MKPPHINPLDQLRASLALPAADELHCRALAQIDRLLADKARLQTALRRQKQHNREVNRALALRSGASEKWLKRALSAERERDAMRLSVDTLRRSLGGADVAEDGRG